MKLSDINETVFQTLSPEVQTAMIKAQETDPVLVIAFVVLMLLPMILMR